MRSRRSCANSQSRWRSVAKRTLRASAPVVLAGKLRRERDEPVEALLRHGAEQDRVEELLVGAHHLRELDVGTPVRDARAGRPERIDGVPEHAASLGLGRIGGIVEPGGEPEVATVPWRAPRAGRGASRPPGVHGRRRARRARAPDPRPSARSARRRSGRYPPACRAPAACDRAAARCPTWACGRTPRTSWTGRGSSRRCRSPARGRSARPRRPRRRLRTTRRWCVP